MNQNWKDRHFFNLTLNPKTKMAEPESYLPNPETNPAAYPEGEMEPMPKKDASTEPVEGTPEADALKAQGKPGALTPISGVPVTGEVKGA